MGGIGIWCMHFIGNRAIVLGDGAAKIQIVYSVPFTAVSFILPVVVLLAAFYAIGTSEKAGYLRIIMGGVLTGSSVCGMHYVSLVLPIIDAATRPHMLSEPQLSPSLPVLWPWVSSFDGGLHGLTVGGEVNHGSQEAMYWQRS